MKHFANHANILMMNYNYSVGNEIAQSISTSVEIRQKSIKNNTVTSVSNDFSGNYKFFSVISLNLKSCKEY